MVIDQQGRPDTDVTDVKSETRGQIQGPVAWDLTRVRSWTRSGQPNNQANLRRLNDINILDMLKAQWAIHTPLANPAKSLCGPCGVGLSNTGPSYSR